MQCYPDGWASVKAYQGFEWKFPATFGLPLFYLFAIHLKILSVTPDYTMSNSIELLPNIQLRSYLNEKVAAPV
jgi:hypothetical protein